MKSLIILTTVLSLSLNTVSQVTINGNDVNPTPGDNFSEFTCNYVSPGSAGANQTWNFSNLTSTGNQTSNVSSSSSNGANIVVNYSGGTNIHYKTDASSQEIKYITTNNSSTIFNYSNGEKTLQFPLSLNTTYTDNFRATFSTNGFPSVRSGSNVLIADGYGTLILPGQTLTDVVRTKLTQQYADTISLSGSPYIINYSSEVYYWYKAGYKAPVLSLTAITALNQTTYGGSYTSNTNIGIQKIENINKITVLGNPFSENLTFSIEAKKNQSVKYELVSITGEIVYTSNQANLITGNNNININTSNIEKGIYALKVSNNNNAITKMIIKN